MGQRRRARREGASLRSAADAKQIHVAKSTAPEEDTELSGKAKKLMHRFTPEEVLKKMEEVEKS